MTPIESSRERVYRRNFAYFLADNILINVGMGIIGAATVIPDFVRHLTASEVLIGLSGSLWVIGQTLPQLLVARLVVRYRRKKWWFVGPNIPARLMMLLFAALLLRFGSGRPDHILLAFFVCYGLAAFGDGVIGVPWADLAGTSLDNRWRARVLGLTTAVVGVTMLLVAPLIGLALDPAGPAFPRNYALLFGAAGALAALSILPVAFVHELPASHAGLTNPAPSAFMPNLGRALRTDPPFRAFILMRILMSLFLMASPFYIGYATVELGLSSQVAVPVLLAMQMAGSIAGALVYTWLGARSNLLVLRWALGGAVLLPLGALLASRVGPLPLYLGFGVSGLATSMMMSGYLNWIVGYAPAERRSIYVGLSNTVAGVMALLAPLISGTLVQTLGYAPLFATSLLVALSALWVALRMLRDGRAETARSGAEEKR